MTLWQDVRLGWRALRRSPGLVVIAAVSLALGIGANSLVFSTARGLLLRPLPVPRPEALFFLQAVGTGNHSFPNYLDFRDRGAAVADLTAYRVAEAAIDAGSGARSSWGYLATGNYFETLGVQPVVGRFFTAAEEVGRNGAPFIVLGYDYWMSAFGGDRTVSGRGVSVNGRPYTVLGVAPRAFHGSEVFFRPEFWIPMTMAPQLEGSSWIDSRSARNVFVAGRLREGVTHAQAATAFAPIAAALASEYPRDNGQLRVTLTAPGLFGDLFRAPAEAFVSVTLALTLLVLLAACTNLAHLLAARVVDRFRELAIRLSLGGTRVVIVRQLLVETLMLCVIGGAAGMAIASTALGALTRWRPAVGVPLALDVNPDAWVLAFGVVTSLVAALLAVAAAARRVWVANPAMLMRPPVDAVRIGRWSSRDVLLGVQVALCSLLVTSCLVAVQGLGKTLQARVGFDATGVFVASFDLNQVGYDRARGQVFRTRLLETIASFPGVDGVTFTSSIPLTTDQSTDTVVPERAPNAVEPAGVDAHAFIVAPGYFKVMQTRLTTGREFARTDAGVLVVNETLARRLFGTSDAIGRTIRGPGGRPLRIIGVAEDGKYALPSEAARPAVFWNGQQVYRSNTQLLVRSLLPGNQVARLIRRAAAQLEPTLPVTFQGPLSDVTSLAFLPAMAAAMVLGALGVLAVVLAITGVYGLAAYSVSARRREIGIRMAVGARTRQVLGAMLGRPAVVVVTGAGAGVALASAASSLLALVVYQATSRDTMVLAAGVLVILTTGVAAATVPARRALSVDPAVTVREG